MLANRCVLCKEELESIDHRLHYDKARILWQLVFSIFGIWWLISDLIRETFLRWCGSFVDRRHKAWRVALSCIFWTIWKERNRRCFECEELLNQRLKDIFLNNFLGRVRVYIEGCTHLVDFIDWLGHG